MLVAVSASVVKFQRSPVVIVTSSFGSILRLLSEFADLAVGAAEVGYPYVGAEFQRFAQKFYIAFFQLGYVGVEIVYLEPDMSEALVVLLQLFGTVFADRFGILE